MDPEQIERDRKALAKDFPGLRSPYEAMLEEFGFMIDANAQLHDLSHKLQEKGVKRELVILKGMNENLNYLYIAMQIGGITLQSAWIVREWLKDRVSKRVITRGKCVYNRDAKGNESFSVDLSGEPADVSKSLDKFFDEVARRVEAK